jgi:hypothetical protein
VQESLEQDPPSDPRILETLELQKQQLEMLIAKTRQGTCHSVFTSHKISVVSLCTCGFLKSFVTGSDRFILVSVCTCGF